jgi:ribosomal small subunit protein bTHX
MPVFWPFVFFKPTFAFLNPKYWNRDYQFLNFFIKKKNATMGKGDKRTKRGKIILGSHGVARPKLVKKVAPKKEA